MPKDTVVLIANGDLRLSANQKCWSEQAAVESAVTRAIEAQGYAVERGHAFDPEKGHGFIDSQKRGREVFRGIDPDRPLVVAVAVWQYSHHLLPGLSAHRGPVLTVANWSGTWPGLVGMLNLNGSLTKAGVAYSSLWSTDFTDESFTRGLRSWLTNGEVSHDSTHVRNATEMPFSVEDLQIGASIAGQMKREHAIMGVFDEGCMGMFNAIIPDHLLHATGIFKERLSQSALYYEATQVSDEDADVAFRWLKQKGMRFIFGEDEASELTPNQILLQLKMYIAAMRIADDFGCDCIGIQYQQGLKDLLPASDLAEGLLNNADRPPVKDRTGTRTLYPGAPLPHFNEVDECAGLDALVTNRVWSALGFDPETTLHDVRWGEDYMGKFVWVLEISGSAPPQHFKEGYADTVSERQPAMYFRLGGGTVKGVSKPGEIVWSRVYVEDGRLKADVGCARVVSLPPAETQRRWDLTTPQWPVMHTVLYGITRDQFMGRHKSNHIQVAYVPDADGARKALSAKVGMLQGMGIETFVCGDVPGLG